MSNLGKRYLFFIFLFVGTIALSIFLILFTSERKIIPINIYDDCNNNCTTISYNDSLMAEAQSSIAKQNEYNDYIAQSPYAKSQNLLSGAKVINLNVIFYVHPAYSDKTFSQSNIEFFLKTINSTDRSDSLYSVREYFQDISYNQIDFKINAYAKIYEGGSLYYHDPVEEGEVIKDITLNIYPINSGIDKSSMFWPSCSTTFKSVKLPKNSTIDVMCHEMIHTFGISDLYTKDSETFEKAVSDADIFVGDWDIMALCGAEPQFPLVYSMGYVSNLTESNYFDTQKSNIEVLTSGAKVNLKATAHANASDTIAIKIKASDLGLEETGNIYFMIEYRKPNGCKDAYFTAGRESLIIYRVNENFYSNVNAHSQKDAFVYIFKKYNIEQSAFARLNEGDTFGSEKNLGYNTIFMPNGTNTKIVIKNIKFNNDNSCSFEITMPSKANNIVFSGTLMDTYTPIADCNILDNGEIIATTNANGVFNIQVASPRTIQFEKNGQIVKEYYIEKNDKNVVLNSNINVCKLNIKNNFAQITISINGQEKVYYSSTIELILNNGDNVKIKTIEYNDYEFTYSGQKNIDITLSEPNNPNIVDRAIDNITNNAQTAINTFKNTANTMIREIKKGFQNLFG